MTTASRIHEKSRDVAGFDSIFDGLIKRFRSYEPLLSPLVGLSDQKLWDLVRRKAPDLQLEPSFYEELRRLRVVLDSIETTHAQTINERALEVARNRSTVIKNELVTKGELISAEKLGEALGVTRQAIHKAAKAGRYFAVEAGRELFFPAFFADQELRERGLDDVLAVLSGESGWSKWLFLTKASGALGGSTPLDALRRNKKVEVLTAARAHIER